MEPGEADGPGPGVEAQSSTAQESSMEASLSPLQEGAKALATEQECDTVSSTTAEQILEAPLQAENVATNTLLQNAAEAVFESPLPEKPKAGTETLPMLGSVAAIETLSQVAPELEEETPITMAEAPLPATKEGTITLDPPEEIPVLTGVDLAVDTVQSTALDVEAPSSHEAPSFVVSPISNSMPSITGDSVSAGSDLPQDTLSAVAVDSTVPSAVGTLTQIAALKSLSTMSTTVSEASTPSEPVLSPNNQPLALATAEPGSPDADTMSPKELLPSENMGPVQELQPSVRADPVTEPAIGQHVQVEMQTIASEPCQEHTSTPATVVSSSLSMGADLSGPFEPSSAALDAGPDQEQQGPFVEALSFSGGEQTSQPGLTVEAKDVTKDLPLSSCSHQAEPLPGVASEQILASGSKPLLPVLDAANIFDNNLVSSVDGETVLIVEGLGVSSSSFRNKTDGDFPGTGGVRVATDLQNEADEDRNVRPMHAERTDLVGQKVKKRFGRKYFEGDVISYDPELKWYKVVYEDGDEEELEFVEVEQILFPPSAEKQGSAERGGSANKRPQRSSGSRRDLRRDSKKGEEFGVVRLSPEAVDKVAVGEVSEKNNQTQENMNFRLLRKRNVVDTSNEMGDEPFNDEVQSSESSEDTSEIKEKSSESQDDPAVEKISRSHRRVRGKKHRSEGSSRLRKRRKLSEDLNVKESVPLEPRLRSRHKPEPALKTQETPTEHRVATRSSTGSLSAHISPSDGRSSPRFKKGAEDSEGKTKLDSPAACMISPLGGGSKLIGRRTRKDFGGQFYSGEIIGYDSGAKYYKVRYEDGDEEELEWNELESTVVPVEEEQKVLSLETPNQAVRKLSKRRLKEHSRRIRAPKAKEGALILYDGGASNGDLPSPTRRWRKKIRTASVSVMMKGTEDWAAPTTPSMESSRSPPRPLAAARFASASDADIFEYFGWGEVVNFEKGKCPELRAARLLPTSSPIIHLAASRHHLAAITAAGQVWVWRCKHGNIHTRCGEWEHVSALDERRVILVDISGPDLDRPSAGYDAEQEDQAPDFFYLAAVCSNGEDIILQGSQPHELVHIYQYNDEPRHLGLRGALLHSNLESLEDIGRIVQVTVGMVEAADESPFVGYITDTDRVYIRSATRDYMEEFNLVTGYTGKPIKIQCGRVYHAIIMTDDGRAWTWGQGYYPGSNSISANFSSKWSSPYCLCQPAVGTLVGRKVVDVGCYGEDFIALTNDGDVHQWTHAVPNPAAGVYNVPATPINGQGPSIASGDKLKQVSIGAGVCAGITECGKVHSWRTAMKGGFAGIVGSEREALTPLGRDEGYKETVISSLGTRFATKIMCIASSLIVVVKRKTKLKRGGKKKSDVSLKGKVQDKLATG